jgi:hypothetical protein
MFDVNRPATLHALTRWWSEFRTMRLSLTKTWKTTASLSSETRQISYAAPRALRSQRAPPYALSTSSSRLRNSRSSTPETPRDDLRWMSSHVPARVVSGSDDESGLHESGTPVLEDADGVSGSADIILVDETHVRPPPSRAESGHDATPTRAPRCLPSRHLRAPRRSTCTRCTTNARPSRARFAVQPRAERHDKLYAHGFHLLPHARVLLLRPRRAIRVRALFPARALAVPIAAPSRAHRAPLVLDVDVDVHRAHDHPGAVRNGTFPGARYSAAHHVGRSCSLPRPRRAQAFPMCSRTSRSASSCAGSGRRRTRKGLDPAGNGGTVHLRRPQKYTEEVTQGSVLLFVRLAEGCYVYLGIYVYLGLAWFFFRYCVSD